MLYWLGYILILIIGTGGLLVLLVRWHRQVSRPILVNLVLVALTLFLTLMGLEFYFKVFFAETDDFDTLARENWRERYYTGTFNSFGYRDKEWTEEMVADKTKVMVVGDSFVEGVGIKYIKDRFSDQLNQLLGPDYVVFNLGRRGASTRKEIEDIVEYPYAPDILVWSYFVNDIDSVAISKGIMEPPKMPPVPPLLSPLVRNSYAINFIYWRVVRLRMASQPDNRWQWRLRAYDNPEAWWLHQQELISIYEGAKSEQIPFFVVVFPSLTNVAESQKVTERVIDLYEQRGVPVLDVADLIEGIPSDELIASAVDAHPNEMVHRLVAEALYEMFAEQGLTSKTEARQ